MRRLLLAGTALLAAAYTANPAEAALTFNFQTTDNPQADAGFVKAGQRWSALLTDNITVNINSGFRLLEPGVIGGAQSDTVGMDYADVRNRLTADVVSADDARAVPNLPAGNALSFYTNDRAGNRIFDNNGSTNNFRLDVNRANAKAIGFIAGNDTLPDADITFSTAYSYDFNPDDGISPGQIDFVGVAAHEIGHALGFTSGVDVVDFYSGPNGPGRNEDPAGAGVPTRSLDVFRVFSVLDLYRFSTAAGTDVLDLSYGGTPFFSLDGSTNMGPFSTGQYNGDGRQASHWKDNLNLGLMDPTLANGERGEISGNDLRAMDVIGYNAVPEPSSLALVGLAGVALLRRRTGRRAC